MIKYLFLILLPSFLFSQTTKITFLDKLSKKPIIGLQIFSESGSFITNTNSEGKFELDIQLLQQGEVKSIIAYNADYFSLEYKLNEIPVIIYLKKNESI